MKYIDNNEWNLKNDVIYHLYNTNQIEELEYKKYLLDDTGTYYPKLKK